jgi:prepilin-type processing-associated H-X9-DG protein
MVGPVLSRVLGALAARHEITVDRLSDTMLLSDAISAAAPQGFADGHVELSIADRERGVELRVGPMTHGGAERLRQGLDVPEVGSLEALADDLRVEHGESGEFLVVAIDALSA